MKKAEFNRIVAEGMSRERRFLVVKVETDGFPGFEIIVNPSENFAAKVNYYNRAYNDDMTLIGVKGTPREGKVIRVTDALMTNNLSDLNWFAY